MAVAKKPMVRVPKIPTLSVLACSVLIFQVFRRQNVGWLGLAVIWHALADASVVFLMTLTRNAYLTEGLVALFGIAGLGIVLALRSAEPPQAAATPEEAAPLLVTALQPVEESPENLEKSRYSS